MYNSYQAFTFYNLNERAPERNRLDLLQLNLSLHHLLNLPFLGTLLHLLPSNQIEELGGENKVTLDNLWV